MINRYLFLFCFSFLFVLVSASITFADNILPADSLRVKWLDGKKFVLHKVDPRETWLQLSHRYNSTVEDLKNANQGVADLKIGQIINVPVNTYVPDTIIQGSKSKSATSAVPESPKTGIPTGNSNKIPILYTVRQGETLFSISRKFDQTVENLKLYNNLSSDILSNGQKLIVKYAGSTENSSIPKPTSPATVPSSSTTVIKDADASPVIIAEKSDIKKIAPAPTSPETDQEKATKTVFPVKKNNGGKTLMQVNETGIAAWIQDGQLNQNKYYGLHRTAPIGTIIKVTNRMNNQFVYVKIVGVLPNTGDNDNLIIKVSQAVSAKLNALDAHFRVELSYGILQ
jgi:LysM repeat protein